MLVKVFSGFPEIIRYDGFDRNEQASLAAISESMSEVDAAYSINLLSTLLEKYYNNEWTDNGKQMVTRLQHGSTIAELCYVDLEKGQEEPDLYILLFAEETENKREDVE